MPRLHFEGPGNASAKEHVLNHLLARIVVPVKAQELEQAEEMVMGDDFPLPLPPPLNPQVRRKRPRESSFDSLIESSYRAQPFASRDNQTVP